MRALLALLAVGLTLPAAAQGAVRSELSRSDGMRLTLDGRTLTAEIAETPHFQRFPTTEAQVYGKRVAGACGTTFRHTREGLVFQRRDWPAGARRLDFHFARDISRRVVWCVVDGEDGADVAFVSFVDPEPARFLAKGRGPSGEWWRLYAWRGEEREACMRFRTGAYPRSSFIPCFDDMGDQEMTLRAVVEQEADVYVFGAVGRSTSAVRVRLADGTVVHADLYRRPRGSRVRAAFFMLVLPRGAVAAGVRAVDAQGRTVGRRRFDPEEFRTSGRRGGPRRLGAAG